MEKPPMSSALSGFLLSVPSTRPVSSGPQEDGAAPASQSHSGQEGEGRVKGEGWKAREPQQLSLFSFRKLSAATRGFHVHLIKAGGSYLGEGA